MVFESREDELKRLKGKWVKKYAWFPVSVCKSGRWIWFQPYEERVNGWYYTFYYGELIIECSYRYGDELKAKK